MSIHVSGALSRGLALSALFLAFGCDGCSRAKSSDPLRFVAQDAEAVLEIRDIGVLARARKRVAADFGGVLPAAQLDALAEELELSLGFDPTTEAGLEAAGLPKTGTVVAQVVKGGAGALWIAPVASQEKLRPVLDKIVKARAGIDETRDTKEGGVTITEMLSSFGPEKVVVAAFAIDGGMLFVGAGRSAKELVVGALTRKKEESIHQNAAYTSLASALGSTWEARFTFPSGSAALGSAMNTLGRSIPGAQGLSSSDFEMLTSAGWVLDFEGRSARIRGRLRLNEKGQTAVKTLFTVKGSTPPGVTALNLADAVVYGQLGIDPMKLIELLAPPGSPSRAKVDEAFATLKDDVNTDAQTELLPLLTGHLSFAAGFGDLSKIPFRELMGAPMSALWTAFGVGTIDAAKIVDVESRFDPGLESRGMVVVRRKSGAVDVRTVGQKAESGRIEAVLLESFGLEKAWMIANEPVITDVIVAKQAGDDLLKGGGARVELRFSALSRQLSAFNIGDLPVLYRSVAVKILDVVRVIDLAMVEIKPAEDGLQMEAAITLSPAAAEKK